MKVARDKNGEKEERESISNGCKERRKGKQMFKEGEGGEGRGNGRERDGRGLSIGRGSIENRIE